MKWQQMESCDAALPDAPTQILLRISRERRLEAGISDLGLRILHLRVDRVSVERGLFL